eukprot:416841-Rhodomonas_salina.1
MTRMRSPGPGSLSLTEPETWSGHGGGIQASQAAASGATSRSLIRDIRVIRSHGCQCAAAWQPEGSGCLLVLVVVVGTSSEGRCRSRGARAAAGLLAGGQPVRAYRRIPGGSQTRWQVCSQH